MLRYVDVAMDTIVGMKFEDIRGWMRGESGGPNLATKGEKREGDGH